jgi:HK97 family phage major capsid protein
MIQETVQPSLIPVLRNRSVVVALGATVLEDLRGNVRFPRQLTTVPPAWLAENAPLVRGDQTFDAVVLKPHRVCGAIAFSTTLLTQSAPNIETIVRNDLVDTIAIAVDEAALVGTGPGNNQPLGILGYAANAAGGTAYGQRAPDVTFGGATNWAEVLDLENNVESANIRPDGTAGYVSSPATKRKWKALQKATNYPVYLWESGDMVNGYRALASNQLSATNQVIFSLRWSDCLVGLWPAFDIVSDTFTMFDSGTIKVTVNLLADVQFRYALSFCASTDSGAQ